MKKIIIVCLVAVVAVIGIVVSGILDGDKKGSMDDQVYTIKVAHYNAPEEPVHISLVEWKRLIEERSKGRVKFELYPSSQLGTQRDVMEQIHLGANMITIADPGLLMDYVPDMGILIAPYLTTSFDSYIKLIDSDWFAGLSSQLRDQRFEILTAKYIYGIRHLLATQPVYKPADLKGLKIRSPKMKLMADTMNYMGASATPLPFIDVYPSLSQGVIDGVENIASSLYGAKFYEQAKYLSLTGHIFMVALWIGSPKYFETMPKELVDMIKETGDEASRYQFQQNKNADENFIQKLKDEGVEVLQPDIEAFKKATEKVYDENFSPELVNKVKGILSE